MSIDWSKFAEFASKVVPHAIELVTTLFRTSRGDARVAIRNIQSHREQTEALWERLEKKLAEKHKKEEA